MRPRHRVTLTVSIGPWSERRERTERRCPQRSRGSSLGHGLGAGGLLDWRRDGSDAVTRPSDRPDAGTDRGSGPRPHDDVPIARTCLGTGVTGVAGAEGAHWTSSRVVQSARPREADPRRPICLQPATAVGSRTPEAPPRTWVGLHVSSSAPAGALGARHRQRLVTIRRRRVIDRATGVEKSSRSSRGVLQPGRPPGHRAVRSLTGSPQRQAQGTPRLAGSRVCVELGERWDRERRRNAGCEHGCQRERVRILRADRSHRVARDHRYLRHVDDPHHAVRPPHEARTRQSLGRLGGPRTHPAVGESARPCQT